MAASIITRIQHKPCQAELVQAEHQFRRQHFGSTCASKFQRKTAVPITYIAYEQVHDDNFTKQKIIITIS